MWMKRLVDLCIGQEIEFIFFISKRPLSNSSKASPHGSEIDVLNIKSAVHLVYSSSFIFTSSNEAKGQECDVHSSCLVVRQPEIAQRNKSMDKKTRNKRG